MDTRAQRRITTLLAVALFAQASPSARAEEDDRERTFEAPSRLRPGLFHLDFDELYLELESDLQWRRVKSSRVDRRDVTQDNRQFDFRESLGFSLHGDVVDPNLIHFNGAFEIGLAQGRYREEVGPFVESDSASGVLSRFDFSLDAFQNKPVSVQAYARRYDDRIPRRFLPSLRERQTEAGVNVLAQTGDVTTEFGVSWNDIERLSSTRIEDDETLETTRFFLNSTWDISERQRLKLAYEHENQDATYQGSIYDFGVIRDEFRLEHEFAFGPDGRHSWDSSLRYNQESGNLARDELIANTQLSFQLTDKLRTSARYGFYRYDQSNIRSDLHKVDLIATYQATDNLRLTLDGYALNERIDNDVETDEYGAQFDIGYRRPTGMGELTVDVAFAWDQARTSGSVPRRIVRDEAHAMHDGRLILLRQRFIEAGSILAHNAARTQFYIFGVDYIFVQTEDRTQVKRLPTGRIADGDVVYFDYAYNVPASARVDTYRTDLLIEHTFDFGLTPFYAFEGRFQQAETSIGTPSYRDNMNRHRMGARYRRDWWSITGEYEIFDDTIEPYDAFHLFGTANLLRGHDHSVDFDGELSLYRFEGGYDAREVWWLDFRVTDRWQLDPYWSVNTSASYRREDDSVDGITDSVDLEMVLAYTRNYLSAELAMEYNLLDIEPNQDDGFGVFFRLRRDLTHLLPTRGGGR